MNGDIMEDGMEPSGWDLQQRVQMLEQQLAALRKELHDYMNLHSMQHMTAANQFQDRFPGP